MKHPLFAIATATLLLPTVPALAATCEVASATYGASRAELAEKRSGTWVLLSDIALSANTVGYGPGGAMAFEATFYDGKAWLAQADASQPDGVLGRHEFGEQEGNVFAVTATAQTWQSVAVAVSMDSLAAINAALGSAIAGMGCQQALLPFRIEGTARTVTWSAESQPTRAEGTFTQEPVILTGIYSSADRDGYFAVGDMNIHVHAVFPSRNFAAHVGAVELLPGAQVFIGQ